MVICPKSLCFKMSQTIEFLAAPPFPRHPRRVFAFFFCLCNIVTKKLFFFGGKMLCVLIPSNKKTNKQKLYSATIYASIRSLSSLSKCFVLVRSCSHTLHGSRLWVCHKVRTTASRQPEKKVQRQKRSPRPNKSSTPASLRGVHEQQACGCDVGCS